MAGLDSSPLTPQMNRRSFLRGLAGISVGVIAFNMAGCGSDDDGTPASSTVAASTPTLTPVGAITPVLLTGEFVVDQNNRFAVGLIDEENNLVRDAQVYAKFFVVNPDGQSGKLRGEGLMQFVELNIEDAHEHDSSGEADREEEAVAFYVATTPFDVAGEWAVELSATLKGVRSRQRSRRRSMC